MANWNEMLKEAFSDTGDSFEKMKTTLSTEELYREFNDDYGWKEGEPFTAWGERYVYFPVVYDGAEWVGYVPRDVCDEPTLHVGGG